MSPAALLGWILAIGPILVGGVALVFTVYRWRRERRPKLLVRLNREPHHEAIGATEGIYQAYAKIWIEVYNDGTRAAEQVAVESKADYGGPKRESSDLPAKIDLRVGFLQAGESNSVLLGRDNDVRFPHPGLPPFTVVARCKGFRCRWEFTLDPHGVLP